MIELLYRALDEELGVRLSTSDPETLRTRLYAARAKAKNPDFEDLGFRIVNAADGNGYELWIIRKGQQDDPA